MSDLKKPTVPKWFTLAWNKRREQWFIRYYLEGETKRREKFFGGDWEAAWEKYVTWRHEENGVLVPTRNGFAELPKRRETATRRRGRKRPISTKPDVPADFPLIWHVRDRTFYTSFTDAMTGKRRTKTFGADPGSALLSFRAWQRKQEADEERVSNGQLPISTPIRKLASEWRSDVTSRFMTKSIRDNQYRDYVEAADEIVARVGNKTLPEMTSEIFDDWWLSMRDISAAARSRKVTNIRTFFNYASSRMMVAPPLFGHRFRQMGNKKKQTTRQVRPIIWTPQQIRAMLYFCNDREKAATLLAINAGLYASDMGQLVPDNLDGHILKDVRAKSRRQGIDYDKAADGQDINRIAWLWPETLDALRTIKRPHKELFFLTSRGTPAYLKQTKGQVSCGFCKSVIMDGVIKPDIEYDCESCHNRNKPTDVVISKGRSDDRDRIGTAFKNVRKKVQASHPDLELTDTHYLKFLRHTYSTVAFRTQLSNMNLSIMDVVKTTMGQRNDDVINHYLVELDETPFREVSQQVFDYVWSRTCDHCGAETVEVMNRWQCQQCRRVQVEFS